MSPKFAGQICQDNLVSWNNDSKIGVACVGREKADCESLMKDKNGAAPPAGLSLGMCFWNGSACEDNPIA